MERAQVIVAGFGYRAGTGTESLAEVLDRAAAGHAVRVLAAPEDKLDALRPLAEARGLRLYPVGAEDLRAAPVLTRSPAALAARGTGSVAEAAALCAARALCGPKARLLGPRQISTDRRATCALATGDPQ